MPGSADITPTPDEVAALIAVRTIDSGGEELGTFTSDTRPTDVQVEGLAVIAARDVMIGLSIEEDELPEELVEEARQLAAIRAAQAVLVSFYPETQGTGTTATYAAAYLAGVEGLATRLQYAPFRLG